MAKVKWRNLSKEEKQRLIRIIMWDDKVCEVKLYINFPNELITELEKRVSKDFPDCKIFVTSVFIDGFIDPDFEDAPVLNLRESLEGVLC